MLPMVLSDIGEVSSEQEDGAPPTILTAGAAPGESGVSIVSMRYARGAHCAATFRQHVISFVSAGPVNCRFAGTKFLHEAQEGSLAICPAGFDIAADTEHDLDSLLIAIRPSRLSLAAAEDGRSRHGWSIASPVTTRSFSISPTRSRMKAGRAIRTARSGGTKRPAASLTPWWPITSQGAR